MQLALPALLVQPDLKVLPEQMVQLAPLVPPEQMVRLVPLVPPVPLVLPAQPMQLTLLEYWQLPMVEQALLHRISLT